MVDQSKEDRDSTKLAVGAGVSMMGTMVGRGASVLSQVALARLLGPEVFGLYALGWTIFRIVGRIAPLGLDQGTLRYASRYQASNLPKLKGLLLQSIRLSLLSGLIAAGGLFLCAPWLAEQVFNKPQLAPVIRWFSPAFLLIPGMRVAVSATRVSQRMQYAVYAEHLMQPALNLLLILAFFFFGWGLSGSVAALGISVGAALLMAVYYVRRLFPNALSRQVQAVPISREVFAFSLVASFAGLFASLNIWVDRLLVGAFRPAAEVGVYQAVSQSSILFATIIAAFNTIFSPMIADLHRRERTEQLDELFKVSTKWGLYISLPLFLVVCFAPHETILVLFGPEYISGTLPLIILAVGQLINVGSGSVGLIMVMTGHQKGWLLVSGLALIPNVVLNFLFIPRLGLPGAALATAISLSGLFIFGLVQVRRNLGLWPYDRRYVKGLFATAIAGAALLLLRWVDVDSAALDLTLNLMVAHAVFVLALALLGLDPEDRDTVRAIWTRLRNSGA